MATDDRYCGAWSDADPARTACPNDAEPCRWEVALVESVEDTVEDAVFRRFKLTAKLRKEVHLTKDDVERIRSHAEKTIYNF